MSRYLVPAVLFTALIVVLALGLGSNPRLVPSPLLGKPLPTFELSRLREPRTMIDHHALKGSVALLNVWATWCISCRQEHDMLLRISAEQAVPIFGLNYKDSREAAVRWLDQLGDPYVAVAFDPRGELGLDLGVYGAPETYLLDAAGNVVYKHIGPMTESVWTQTLLPRIRSIRGGSG
ncbi:MAG: DsbE family thiol:disulfide interchange protein [Gammaproteobacteria bacterium]|nr:DsbE family thiol:disulfide interchange protein [Gammaproteobacteria bacterium]